MDSKTSTKVELATVARRLGEPLRNKARAERKQRRREIRCFWSWPLGHIYDPTAKFTAPCMNCGHVRADHVW